MASARNDFWRSSARIAALVRQLAPLLPLPFLVALAAWGSARAAEFGGAALGAGLAAVAAVVGTEQAPFDEEDELDGTVPVSALGAQPAHGDAKTASASVPKRGKARSGQPATVSARSVFVSAEKVLRLSESRVTPKGVRVPASGARPAGLSLTGVAGLGIGLRDGDILTRALGQPALSSSAVIRAILVARAQRVKVLEGEFYRDGERWTLRVEQPYLDEPKRP
jgi:hypothetical protein